MKNLPSFIHRAVLAVVGTLALGACSRGNYAVLPKSPAYLGPAPVAATAPRAASQVRPATLAPEAVAAPAAKPVAATVATAQSAAPAPATSSAPVAAAEAIAAHIPAKPTMVQRLALKKLTKKLDKLAGHSPKLGQRDAAASTSRTDGGLRQALVLGVIGLAIILLGALLNLNIIYVIGVIVIIIALVLLLLYLINQM